MLFFSFCFGFMKFVTDYITYQGWDDPYVPRTHEGLLKWKYANLNSVDFLFEVIITFFSIVLEFWYYLVSCLILTHLLICSCFYWQVEGERELLFVNERGKKKLMDGNKVAFPGQTKFILFFICPILFLSAQLVIQVCFVLVSIAFW